MFVALVFAVPASPDFFAQELRPAGNFNHFIVLVDASGSTAISDKKRKAYVRALEAVEGGLFESGFGDRIPVYQPAVDFLTVHHFGIVTGATPTAYERLASYDFPGDFIHRSLLRRKSVSREEFRAVIFPTVLYQYTVLSWAKELALHSSGVSTSEERSNRTFLIVAHDGIPNQNSLNDEVEMIRRWAKAEYESTAPVVDSIASQYRFTDGTGKATSAWQRSFMLEGAEASETVFVEAYEVVPTRLLDWKIRGEALVPIDDIEVTWTSDSGSAVEGTFDAKLTAPFSSWLAEASHQELFVSFDGGPPQRAEPGTPVPIALDRELTCGENEVQFSILAKAQSKDLLFGVSEYLFTYSSSTVVPGPYTCTVVYTTSRGLLLLLGGLAIVAICYFLYYRFRTTHIEIELPGTIVPLVISRGYNPPVEASMIALPKVEAFGLKLPGLFLQRTLYRGATISLSSTDASINWATAPPSSTLTLPIRKSYVIAEWGALPAAPVEFMLVFTQGRTVIRLLFKLL